MDDVVAQQNPPQEVSPVKSSNTLLTVFKYVAIGTGILGIGFLIALGGYLYATSQQKKSQILQPSPSPVVQNSMTPTPTSTPVATPFIIDAGAGQRRYTNPQFGITFIFPTNFNGGAIGVKEDGNKIYVYDTKYDYKQGQYVEVFQKLSEDSLTAALQKEFLAGISPADCFVKDGKPDLQADFPSNYEVKTLGYPVNPNSDLPSFAQPNKCPANYAETNGISYFLGDTKHTKIFLFFSIGQYAFPIDTNTNKSWQDTIEFL